MSPLACAIALTLFNWSAQLVGPGNKPDREGSGHRVGATRRLQTTLAVQANRTCWLGHEATTTYEHALTPPIYHSRPVRLDCIRRRCAAPAARYCHLLTTVNYH